MTYQFKDKFTLFANQQTTNNGRAGDPKWVADFNLGWTKGPVTLTYGLNVIAATNDYRNLQQVGGPNLTLNNCLATAAAYALRGGPYCPIYKLPRVAYHSLSAEVQVNRDFSFLFGVSNLFDKKAPLVSTVGAPISTFGQVPLLGTYYQQGWIGRRFFISAKAKIPNF
jgi:iron complex outermembrane receptor protein